MRRDPGPPSRGASTLGVHAGGYDTTSGQPVASAVVQSSTFVFRGKEDEEVLYSRYGNNPNQRQVGRKVAALEGMEAGAPLASGMAATAMTLLALTEHGDHVVAARDLYGATRRLLASELPRRGVETTFVDSGDREAWSAALRPETRVFYFEIPTNPALRVIDPRPLAALAREHGVTLVSDATFASPINLRAGELGVDVVIHSASKYLGGHSDLIAGVVAGSREVVERIVDVTTLYGPSLDPHACWLLDRGMRTLDVRVRRHNENALAIARWLESQGAAERVERVIHPGLESHPDHRLASEILSGFGGVVSLVLRGGGAAADRFVDALSLAIPAPSLGGVETLVSQPRHTSHAGWSAAEREAAGIADGFVRISVGIEDVDDLIADLAGALAAAG